MSEQSTVPGVAVIDDDFLIADLVTDQLQSAGIFVSGCAASALEARQLVTATQPIVAIVDIRIGTDDGIQLAEELKAAAKIKVIFLTGASDHNTLMRARAIGPADILQKPISTELLVQSVRRALKSESPDMG